MLLAELPAGKAKKQRIRNAGRRREIYPRIKNRVFLTDLQLRTLDMETVDNHDTVSESFIWLHSKMKP